MLEGPRDDERVHPRMRECIYGLGYLGSVSQRLFLRNMGYFLRMAMFAILFGVGALQARPVPARIILPDGSEQVGTFLKLKADSVYFTVGEGDSLKSKTLYKLDLKKIQLIENDSLVDLSLTDYEVHTVLKKDTAAVKDTTPVIAKGRSVLAVSSYPADARVYVDNVLVEGLTPLVVSDISDKKHVVTVRKFLKGVDWWGIADAKFKDGQDTLKLMIKLDKPRTMLKVQSNPSGAEMYLDAKPDLNHMPKVWTDTTLLDVVPGLERSIYLFKIGYYDTTVTVPVEAFMPNLVGIDLKPISEDLQRVETQMQFVHGRKLRWVGRGLLWGSLAPLAASITMIVLANNDWAKAVDFKHSYQDAAFASTETDRFISENTRLNKSGDQKAYVALGLVGGALAMSCVGIVLQF